MCSIAPDLLKDCPQRIVGGVLAQHKSLARVHQERIQLTELVERFSGCRFRCQFCLASLATIELADL